MTADRFHEARLSCVLSIAAAAKLLRVTERTLHNWEKGRTRIPYSAYKLMRILRNGELLSPFFRDFRIWRDTLYTPEGHALQVGQLSWWSLTCGQARFFRQMTAERRQARQDAALAALASDAGALALRLIPVLGSAPVRSVGSPVALPIESVMVVSHTPPHPVGVHVVQELTEAHSAYRAESYLPEHGTPLSNHGVQIMPLKASFCDATHVTAGGAS